MGAGASLAVPERVDKTTAKALAGDAWTDEHEKEFDAAAVDGVVTKAQFEAYAAHTTEKRCFGTGCGGCGNKSAASTTAGANDHSHDHDHDHAHKHDHDHEPAAAATTEKTSAAVSES